MVLFYVGATKNLSRHIFTCTWLIKPSCKVQLQLERHLQPQFELWFPFFTWSTTVITVPTTATMEAIEQRMRIVKDLIFVKTCKSDHSSFSWTAHGKINAINAEPMAPERQFSGNEIVKYHKINQCTASMLCAIRIRRISSYKTLKNWENWEINTFHFIHLFSSYDCVCVTRPSGGPLQYSAQAGSILKRLSVSVIRGWCCYSKHSVIKEPACFRRVKPFYARIFHSNKNESR